MNPPEAASSNYDPARVLVVDDNPALQFTLKSALEIYGFEVATASDGIEALELVRANPKKYDVLVTDQDMPKMDGLELVRAVRDLGFKGRIVVVSGRLGVEDLQSYQDCDISGFFHKPFDTALLATLLLQN